VSIGDGMRSIAMKHLLSKAAFGSLVINSWVNECEHHGWLLETLANGLGITLRIRD